MKINPIRLIACIAAVIALVALALPWVSVALLGSYNAFSLNTGYIALVIIGALVAGASALWRERSAAMDRLSGAGVLAGGFLIIITPILVFVRIDEIRSDILAATDLPIIREFGSVLANAVSLDYGVWLTLAAGIVVMAAGLWSLIAKRSEPEAATVGQSGP